MRQLLGGLGLGCVLTGALTGCDGGTAAVEDVVVRDSAGVRVVEHPASLEVPAWRLSGVPRMTIGANDGIELFGVVAARRMADGAVAVADGGNRRLLIRGPDGEVREIGGQGAGPGEFLSIGGLWIAGDTLLASDPAAGRISTFVGGEVVRTDPLPPPTADGFPMVTGRFDDGDYLTLVVRPYGSGAAPGLSPDSVTVLRFRSGREPARIGRFLFSESFVAELGGRTFVTGRPFAPAGLFAPVGDDLWYGRSDRYELRRYGPDGRLWTVVHVARRGEEVDEEAFREALEAQAGGDPDVLRETARLAREMPMPETKPVMERLRGGPRGELWVREAAPDGAERVRWSVFAPDGRMRARVDAPAALTVLEVGDDHLLGVERDEAEVESVVWYDLRRDG